MNRHSVYIILLLGAFVWCAMLLLPPVAASVQLPFSRDAYKFFSSICHQDDGRSLHILGNKFAVCARCSAIYFGFLLGVLFSPWLSKKVHLQTRLFWVIAILPMLIDIAFDTLGIHQSTIFTRLPTGAFFGIVAALILVPIFEKALNELVSNVTNYRGEKYESAT